MSLYLGQSEVIPLWHRFTCSLCITQSKVEMAETRPSYFVEFKRKAISMYDETENISRENITGKNKLVYDGTTIIRYKCPYIRGERAALIRDRNLEEKKSKKWQNLSIRACPFMCGLTVGGTMGYFQILVAPNVFYGQIKC